jgi:hypothetical protein
MLSRAWHPAINMLSNQKAGLMQEVLDKKPTAPIGYCTVMKTELGQVYV